VLTVLGPDEGPRFADAHGIAALFSVRGTEGLECNASAAWKARRD
jgi:thiamine biosynthesis lipoprotein